MSTFQQYNLNPAMTPVRLVASSNQSGTYFNGPVNNGVGATFTYATGALSIDSVTVNVGDRILFAGQSSAFQNGVYVCNVAGATGVAAVLQRAADMQCLEQLHTGFFVPVAAGTIEAGAMYAVVEPKPAAFGINNLTFVAVTLAANLGTAAFKAASDNTQPSLSSVNGATVANNLAVFADTAGSVKAASTASTLGFGLTLTTGNLNVSAGNVVAGSSGSAGVLQSFPSAATSGSLRLVGVANAGNFNVDISNASHGQATVYSIADVGAATGQLLNKTLALVSGNVISASGTAGIVVDGGVAANKILSSSLANPDVSIDLVSFDVTCGQAALAAGGAVALITSSGSKQYKVRSLQLNSGGTNFSGGGGDRLGQVTDGTTVYSVVPAATMQALVNAQWGVTALPNPASAAINTSTAAGANLNFKYSGGTTDYTAGSLVISGIVQRVA
jgi:hypothetical protein